MSQVIQIAKEAVAQTKQQKDFNRFVKKIEKLEKDVLDYREGLDRFQQRIASELVPLKKQQCDTEVELVKCYDRAYQSGNFKKSENKKLAALLQELAFQLIEQGYDELKEIYDRYDETGYDATVAEAEAAEIEQMKKVAEMMLGIKFEDDIDLSDPEKLKEHIAQKFAEKHNQKDTTRAERPGKPKPEKPKSEKQIAREEKKQAEKKNTTKAVRTIYLDLVKTFHPDREPDETERNRKTLLMQRVTEAYENNDILGLLRLQLEYNRIDQGHLERLADEQLKYYNKILKEQTADLEQQLAELRMQAQSFSTQPFYLFESPFALDIALDKDLKNIKKTISRAKKEVLAFNNDDYIREVLKTYRIQ